jgi:hypothetical protein
MGIAISIVFIVAAFGAGMLWSKQKYLKQIKECGCPFHHACMEFDQHETRAAVKRVLTLLVENDVPKDEIQSLIEKSLS